MQNKERLTDALSRLGRSLAKAGDRIANETKLIADLSRLRIKLKDEQYNYQKTMEAIGTRFYNSYGEADMVEYEADFQRAEELKEQMKLLDAAIEGLIAKRKGNFYTSPTEGLDVFLDERDMDNLLEESLRERQDEAPEETRVPCPHCGHLISKSLAYCTNCKEKL